MRYYLTLLTCFYSLMLFGQDWCKGVVKDSKTLEPLAFATVIYAPNKGVITNENGVFKIPCDPTVDSLIIRYVGYETAQVPFSREGRLPEILLKQFAMDIEEIVVYGTNLFPSRLLFQSIKTSRKQANIRRTSKAFRRTYSYRDQLPSEHMEAFYNTQTQDGGIEFFKLKNGRYSVPSDTSFINLQTTLVLEQYKLFIPEFAKLPSSPLEYTSLKKLRKDYDIRIVNRFAVEQDTIVKFSFEPLRQTKENFSGMAWVRLSNLVIEKVALSISNTSRNPFLILPDPELNKAKTLDLDVIIGFKYHEEQAVFDYINFDYEMLVHTPVNEFKVRSTSNFYFYDYDQAFQLPFFSVAPNLYHDYEKVLFFPYDPVFWEKNFLIAETNAERLFREKLELRRLYDDQGGQQTLMIRRRFEPWHPNWQITPELVAEERRTFKEEEENFPQLDYYPRYDDPLYAHTFIFLDYACYPDTIIFNTEAIIDYRLSYAIKRDSTSFDYLENFLLLTKTHANLLKSTLAQKYSGSSNCPKYDDLKAELAQANKALKKALRQYHRLVYAGSGRILRDTHEKIRMDLQGSFSRSPR